MIEQINSSIDYDNTTDYCDREIANTVKLSGKEWFKKRIRKG